MRAIHVTGTGLETLKLVDVEQCTPDAGQICVRIEASSLNYHDYIVALGMIPTPGDRVPMSDGAGKVVSVGEGVTEFEVGDRVVSTFFPLWIDGEPTRERMAHIPGDTIDGFAREYVCAASMAFTLAPDGYSAEESATLTCAGLTAWRGLVVEGSMKAGDTVLVMGTGGVSIFALQFAKAAGATVIATSSSDAKLERLSALGADHVINYIENPEWGKTAKAITGGRGVDHVVEIGGPGTMAQSIAACRYGGHIALIGVLTGISGEVPTAALFTSQITLSGISVGSRAHQLDMIRAIESNGIKPVIDRSYPLEEISAAFRHQESQQHFGKICLSL